MESFVARHRPLVTGVLCGFDRLVFRGSLRPLMAGGGMYTFLTGTGVRLLDYGRFVLETSERVKAASLAEARAKDRPIVPLRSAKASKEDLARRLLNEHPLDAGLICALTIVEPCM